MTTNSGSTKYVLFKVILTHRRVALQKWGRCAGIYCYIDSLWHKSNRYIVFVKLTWLVIGSPVFLFYTYIKDWYYYTNTARKAHALYLRFYLHMFQCCAPAKAFTFVISHRHNGGIETHFHSSSPIKICTLRSKVMYKANHLNLSREY